MNQWDVIIVVTDLVQERVKEIVLLDVKMDVADVVLLAKKDVQQTVLEDVKLLVEVQVHNKHKIYQKIFHVLYDTSLCKF